MMTQSATILNVAVVHAIATQRVESHAEVRNLPIACAMGASAGMYDASAWKNPPPTSAWGRFQTSTATRERDGAPRVGADASVPRRRLAPHQSGATRRGEVATSTSSSSSSDIAASRSMTSLVLPGGS